MKKFILIASMLLANVAFAGDYATLDYSLKDKQASSQENHVLGLNVGRKYESGFAAEVRMEDENVRTPTKHEGLIQIKANQDITTIVGVTPFVGLGTGWKSKSDDNFNFYVAEVGAKTTVAGVSVKYAYRLRDAYGSGHDYHTTEHSLTSGFALDKSNSVFVKYARERGDSDYNTWGVGLTHAF